MKQIVTGGEGFIGSHIVSVLGCESYDIKSDLDVLNKQKFSTALKDKDIVFHCAAKISVPDSFIKKDLYEQTNVVGTKNLAEISEQIDVKKIIFSSSAAVYGEYNRKVKETDLLQPQSPYAQQKITGEKILLESSVNSICLRYFNVYGSGQSDEYAGVITTFIKDALQNKDLVIFGDGMQERDFIYIDDVVSANVQAGEIINLSNEIINIGSGKTTNIKTLAQMIIDLCKSKSKIIYKEKRDGDIYYSGSDINKAKDILDWTPEISLEDGLSKTISFYSKNLSG